MTNKEAIEELKKVDTLDMPARLCEAHYMAIKALEQEPYEDCVSRKAVIDTLDNMDKALDDNRTVEEYKALLKECYEVLPSVNPQEPKTGHWIDMTSGYAFNDECSECGYIVHIQFIKEYQFCPHCGAKMVEPQESEE